MLSSGSRLFRLPQLTPPLPQPQLPYMPQSHREESTVLHPVRRSPRLNPILQILPADQHYFSYGGVNYKRVYRLVWYRGRCYAVPELRVLEDDPERK